MSMSAGSSMLAITRSFPPQRRQRKPRKFSPECQVRRVK